MLFRSYGRLIKPKDKDKVIGPGKPNEVSNKAHGSVELANRSKEPKRISKRAKEAQRKAIGPWMPKGKPKGT